MIDVRYYIVALVYYVQDIWISCIHHLIDEMQHVLNLNACDKSKDDLDSAMIIYAEHLLSKLLINQ